MWSERVLPTLVWLMEGAPGVSMPHEVLEGIRTRLTEEAGLRPAALSGCGIRHDPASKLTRPRLHLAP